MIYHSYGRSADHRTDGRTRRASLAFLRASRLVGPKWKGEPMIELSREARTVLQCIDDLQFTGRPNPRRAEFLAGASALVFFDPVPFVAICGELAPVEFDIECQLRLLETEQAITHLIHNSLQIRTYTRPDGKTVTVDRVRDDDEVIYRATVNGQMVCEHNVDIPMNPGDRTHGLRELHYLNRIVCYRITPLGRAALRHKCGVRIEGDKGQAIIDSGPDSVKNEILFYVLLRIFLDQEEEGLAFIKKTAIVANTPGERDRLMEVARRFAEFNKLDGS